MTAYEYNEINKLSTLTDPLGATVQYTYDSLGNLKQTIDKKGTVIQYQYDGLGRMTSQASSDETIAMAYNMLDKPTSITDGTGTTVYTYDGLSRLTKEEKNGIVKTYQYDPNGNRTLFQLNSNGTLELNTSYTYDELNRLSSVVNGEDETSYTYDFNGNLLSANTNNQSIAEYTYNKAGLLTAQTSKKSPTELLAEYSVQYYLNGNRSGVQETGKPSVSYVYDGMGRLSKETVENTSVTDYLYDSNQNRSQKTVQNLADNTVSTTNYTYNRNNWLLSEETAGVQKTYSYDANGNQTAVQQGENTDTFTYDSLNRMAKTVIGGTETTYTYDYSGLRQTKTTGGLTTKHIYDGKNIVMDEKSGEKQVYHRGLSLVSRTVNGGDKEYYSFNVHGDTAALFDAAGTITKNYDYDAFGNQTTAQENDNNPFRYCGEYFDNETNFIYLRARYYNSETGRFTTEDPAKDGVNWFVYCENNPINFRDPTGNWAEDGSDSRFKDNNPVVYRAIEDLSNTWIKLDNLEKQGYNIGNMKQEVEELANVVRAIGDKQKIPSTQVKLNDKVYKNLTSTEAVLFYANPTQGVIVGLAADSAISTTKSEYGHNNDSTIANAFQHALWNAISVASGAGSEFTRLFTNAHEYGIPDNFNDIAALNRTKMDLFNNGVGRYQGSLCYSEHRVAEAIKRIKERANNGGLIYLE